MGVGGGSRQHGSFRSFCLRCRYCGQELIFASTGMTLELASAYRDVYQENCLASAAQATAATEVHEGTGALDGATDTPGMVPAETASSQVTLDDALSSLTAKSKE